MFTFYDSENKPYELDEQIGRGGEGTVYVCDDFNLVAKIYHEPITDEKAEKLRWMARNKNEHLLKVAAWVIDVLHDAPNGKVVGFLMPNVKAKEIHELYSLKSRRVYFPEATWHFLVNTAANVARAFYSLHKNLHVMGDVNHGNCVVLADGTVKLIDCDSYSIKKGDSRYVCDVGVATHVPPELQGVDLGDVERVENHDNFGLAVIIFQLLFLGRHPFAGNYLGAEDKSLEDCIREQRFAYGADAESRMVRQPPGTLSLTDVSPRLSTLFERAFLIGEERPEPREWIEALEDLSNNLENCSIHPGHHFFNKLVACPWCRIESQTGLMLFPFVSSAQQDGKQPFNIFTVENLISNLGVSNNLPAKPQISMILPPPMPEIVEAQKQSRKNQSLIIGGQFVSLVFLMAVFGVGIALFIGVVLLIFLIMIINNSDKTLRTEMNEKLYAVQREWEELENNWNQTFVPKELNENINRIRERIGAYQNFQKSSVRQLERIRAGNRRNIFNKHLRSIDLTEAKIPGVRPNHIDALVSGGIKTAADIEESKLESLFLVHDDVKHTMLKWREELVKNFDFATEEELPEADKRRFSRQTDKQRRTIESEIERLLSNIHSGAVYVRNKQNALIAKSEQIAAELVQSESNSQILGSNSTAIVLLLLVTFFPPLIVGSFMKASFEPPRPKPVYSTDKTKSVGEFKVDPDYGSGRGGSSGDYWVDENITDKDIAVMSESNRKNSADALYDEAKKLTENETGYNDGNYGNNQTAYEIAEKKMRLAVRLARNVQNLNQLGYILYEQGKHDESLEFLKQAEKLDKRNTITKITIGLNYLEMKNYKAARDVFTKVTFLDATSSQGFFNLGLALKGQKNHKAAANAFEKAVKLDPDDVDSIYELGLSLKNSGDVAGAERQYEILTDIDGTTAEKLKTDAELNNGHLVYPRHF